MWLKIDDGFSDHRKVDGLSDGAFRLHVAGMNYAARTDTNGHIPTSRPARLTPTFKRQYITELESAGLWDAVDDGWWIHDFLVYNPSAEDLKAKRDKERDKKRTQRAAGAKNVAHDGDGRFMSPTLSPGDTKGDRAGDVPHAVPGGVPGGSPPLPDPKGRENPLPQTKVATNGSSAPPRVRAPKPEDDSDFGAWWAQYPRKVERKDAASAYAKARRSATAADILAGLARWNAAWRAEGRPIDKTPYPATWLNKGAWADDLADPVPDTTACMVRRPDREDDLWGGAA